jgi:hypothetical protein
MNRVTTCLKDTLCEETRKAEAKAEATHHDISWRSTNFTLAGEDAIFGAGRLSISIGKFAIGHKVCILAVFS